MDTSSVINTLFIVALVLLIGVSIGILYLSTLQWRDRRLQSRDKSK